VPKLASKTVEIRGVRYTIRKLPAVAAKTIIDNKDDLAVLSSVEVRGIPLDNEELIDELLPDWEVMGELIDIAAHYNFSFLEGWRPIRFPASMAGNYNASECRYIDPIFSTLISSSSATLLELKQDYSLEEAFQLLEVLTVARVNEYKAREASS
jgi:hypothetical protein